MLHKMRCKKGKKSHELMFNFSHEGRCNLTQEWKDSTHSLECLKWNDRQNPNTDNIAEQLEFFYIASKIVKLYKHVENSLAIFNKVKYILTLRPSHSIPGWNESICPWNI